MATEPPQQELPGLQPLLAQTGKPAAKAAAAGATAATIATDKVALVSLDDDLRYGARRLERAYPGHPGGRVLQRRQRRHQAARHRHFADAVGRGDGAARAA